MNPFPMPAPIRITSEFELAHATLHTMLGVETFRAAVNLNVFEFLSADFKPLKEITEKLGLKLKERNLWDFFDKLVVMGLLERQGIESSAKYKNTESTNKLFVKSSPENRLPLVWLSNRLAKRAQNLEKMLLTDPETYVDPFIDIYAETENQKTFLYAMKNIQQKKFEIFAQKFSLLEGIKSAVDVGGGLGVLVHQIKKYHPKIQCTNFDMPKIEPLAREFLEQEGFGDQIKFESGDFFKDQLPKADCVLMGSILCDWNQEKKALLMKKAFEAVNENGVFVVIETFIDSNRLSPDMGLDQSLIMIVDCNDGYHMTTAEFENLAKSVGFKKSEFLKIERLEIAVAYK